MFCNDIICDKVSLIKPKSHGLRRFYLLALISQENDAYSYRSSLKIDCSDANNMFIQAEMFTTLIGLLEFFMALKLLH